MREVFIKMLRDNIVAKYYRAFGIKVVVARYDNEKKENVNPLISHITYVYKGEERLFQFHNLDVNKISHIMKRDLENGKCTLLSTLKNTSIMIKSCAKYFMDKEFSSNKKEASKNIKDICTRYLNSEGQEYLKKFFKEHKEGFLEIWNYTKLFPKKVFMMEPADKFIEDIEVLIPDMYVYVKCENNKLTYVYQEKDDDGEIRPFVFCDINGFYHTLNKYLKIVYEIKKSHRNKREEIDKSIKELKQWHMLAYQAFKNENCYLKDVLSEIESDALLLEDKLVGKDNKKINKVKVEEQLLNNDLDKSLVQDFYKQFGMQITLEHVENNNTLRGLAYNKVYISSAEKKAVYQNISKTRLTLLMQSSIKNGRNKILELIKKDEDFVNKTKSVFARHLDMPNREIYWMCLASDKNKFLVDFFKVNYYGLVRLYDKDLPGEINCFADKKNEGFVNDIYAYVIRDASGFIQPIKYIYNLNSLNFSIVNALIKWKLDKGIPLINLLITQKHTFKEKSADCEFLIEDVRPFNEEVAHQDTLQQNEFSKILQTENVPLM